MIKYFFLLLLFAISVSETPGQDMGTGSEEKDLLKLPDDTVKVNRLNAYAEKIQFSEPGRAISIIQANITLADRVKYPLGLSVAYSLRAGLLFYEMKLDSCKLLLDKAYAIVNKNKDRASRNQSANLINRYAAIDHRQQNYVSAVERYLLATNIFKETGDEPKIMNSYYNLSGIYKYLGDTAKTFLYARETNRLAIQANDPVLMVRGLIALGEAYNFIKNYDSLKFISEKGLRLATRQGMTFAIGIFNNFTGLYHANKTMLYDSAIIHYNIALESFNKINIPFDISLVLQNMGNAYLKKKDYNNAVKFSKQAADLSADLKFDLVLHASLMDLVLAEEKLGHVTESYDYLKQYVKVNDSIQSRNSQKKVYELEVKYQTQKGEMMMQAQQKIIKQKNLLNYLLTSGVIALLLIVSLLYLNYRNKQKLQLQRINKLETQQQLMAAEAVLRGEDQERSRLAKDLHDGLGGMLSGIKYSFNSMKGNLVMTTENALAFERSMDMLDSSINEMRRVAHNMMPEALVKFGLDTALKDFCNNINQSGALMVSYQSFGFENPTIPQTIAVTVYRIIQELLNNIMKHAAAKTAVVQLTKISNQLSVTVEDDGKGFDTALLQQQKGSPDGQGIGWSNIQNRIEFLKGTLDIRSEKGKGTSVHMELFI